MSTYDLSLAGIDVGFDVRAHDMPVNLPPDLTYPVRFTCDPPPNCGTERLTIIAATRAELMQQAYACGYRIADMTAGDLYAQHRADAYDAAQEL